MKLTTGDIITSKIPNNPFFYHKGIVLIQEKSVLIVHNTPMHKNSNGGNVVIDTLEEFREAGRKIIGRKPTAITAERIMASLEALQGTRFSTVNFNCEDFIFFVRTGKRRRYRLHLLNRLFPMPRMNRR